MEGPTILIPENEVEGPTILITRVTPSEVV